MRYYLVGSEGEERVVDLVRTRVQSREQVVFEFLAVPPEGAASPPTDAAPAEPRIRVAVRQLAGQLFASCDGVRWHPLARETLPKKLLAGNRFFDLYRGFKPSGAGGGDAGDLVTQMPGLVVKLKVRNGESVKKGDTLVILEAMKMENEIKSSRDGTVKEIHVREGEKVDQGRLLMELEAV